MNDKQSLFFLWATILNQSQDASKVLDNTIELFKRLDIDKNIEKYRKLTYEEIEEKMTLKPSIHRFPINMSKNLFFCIKDIEDFFDGKPQKVFEAEDINVIRKNLLNFRGIGEHKVDTAILVLLAFREQEVDFGKNKCISLYRTIEKELNILNELGR